MEERNMGKISVQQVQEAIKGTELKVCRDSWGGDSCSGNTYCPMAILILYQNPTLLKSKVRITLDIITKAHCTYGPIYTNGFITGVDNARVFEKEKDDPLFMEGYRDGETIRKELGL